jgi:hypothetical protein
LGNQGDVQVAHAIMTDANGFPAAVFRIAKGAIRASVIAAEVAGHINRSLQKIRCGPELSQMSRLREGQSSCLYRPPLSYQGGGVFWSGRRESNP